MRAPLAALVALALLLTAAASALAAQPRASLPDLEDEVMCMECKTALGLSDAPVANQQREYILGLIDQGKSKDQIKAALVREYGPRVLAEPQERGFELVGWVVPGLAGLAALALVALVAARWRGAGRDEEGKPGPEPAPLSEADARRLDSELAAFDR